MPVRRGTGADNTHLEITLYKDQLQLGTKEVLYSDGDRYTPAVAAIKELNQFLPGIHTVLALGAGLCSIVHVVRKRKIDPHFTLVEKDKVVLEWAMELLEPNGPDKIRPVCADAMAFMQANTAKYDLLFLDVFKGRVVPSFVYTVDFLSRCRDCIAPGGHIAFNYIVNSKAEWEEVKNAFTSVFPESSIVASAANRILIGRC